MLGNRPEVFAAWVGAARMGALVVPVSYRFTVSEVAYLLEDSQAAAFVYEDEAVGGEAVKGIDTLRVVDQRRRSGVAPAVGCSRPAGSSSGALSSS